VKIGVEIGIWEGLLLCLRRKVEGEKREKEGGRWENEARLENENEESARRGPESSTSEVSAGLEGGGPARTQAIRSGGAARKRAVG